VVRDAERTKQKILDAATTEFAAAGIAGARVDRIAALAGCNKAMIYAYFGNKDKLFDAVFTAQVADVIEHVPFDATDLPGYAGRLFDRFEAEPATLRLSTWYQLERPAGVPLEALVASNSRKLDAIAAAQEAGSIPREFTPIELLALVRSAAMSWWSMTPELGRLAPPDAARRRGAVVAAVERLVAAES
jgi:AcrR family transcriptional regulator